MLLTSFAADDADEGDGADSFLLLVIADLAGSPFHGLSLGDCDLLDGTRTFVQTSTVAVRMVAFGLWAGTYIHHAALQRFKSLEAVQFSYATCNVLRTFKWCKWHTRKNYCQYDCCYCLHD